MMSNRAGRKGGYTFCERDGATGEVGQRAGITVIRVP